MSKIRQTLHTFHYLEKKSTEHTLIHSISPLSKLIVSIGFIGVVVSFPTYELFPLLTMGNYLLITLTLAQLSLILCLRQLKWLLIFLGLIGIFNPILDQAPIIQIGPFLLTSGMISMITLMIKGIYALISSYLLIATTSIEEICYALKQLHLPDLITTTLLLSYRHLYLLLSELHQMITAYELRMPQAKGIHFEAWGSFVGYFLIRNIQRAEALSESMTLRGFNGNLTISTRSKVNALSFFYAFFWICCFLFLRFII